MPAVIWILGGLAVVFLAGGLEAVGIVIGALLILVGGIVAWSQGGDVEG